MSPLRLKLALLCPALTETTWLTLPSEMVSELAIALVKDIIPLTLYWLVVDRHSEGEIARVSTGAGATEQETGAV
ncbi:hypothetical protein GCM10027341_06030 [Spirosoma knui]